MSRKSDKKPKSSSAGDTSAGRWAGRAAWAIAAAVLVAGGALVFSRLEDRVLNGQVGQAPRVVRVELAERPAWMPAALAGLIARQVLPAEAHYYDSRLVEHVRAASARCPWVRRVVNVEKYPAAEPGVAVVEVRAEFRMPVARVGMGPDFAYVDAEGVRLPAGEVPRWAGLNDDGSATYYLDRGDVPRGRRYSRIHYITIEGVSAAAPPVGQRWEGEDLASGLRLTALVATRPYAHEITAIDVRNHGGRVCSDEPQLRMYAQMDQGSPTDIRFGRFPLPGGDYVVSPARKLAYLDEYVQDHDGRLAGLNRYIDLRYDELHVSFN